MLPQSPLPVIPTSPIPSNLLQSSPPEAHFHMTGETAEPISQAPKDQLPSKPVSERANDADYLLNSYADAQNA